MHTRERIVHVKEKVKRLRRISRELVEHSNTLHRQSARLRAFTPVLSEHLVKLRLDDSIALTGTLAQPDGIVDGDMSATVTD